MCKKNECTTKIHPQLSCRSLTRGAPGPSALEQFFAECPPGP